MRTEDTDPLRFHIAHTEVRRFRQAYVHEGRGGIPLLLVHGWPETKRIWWRVVAPLVAAGFEVIAPDLRGHGDSGRGPDGYQDVPCHSRDLAALLDELGHDSVVAVGGDLGGLVLHDLSLRFPGLVDRLVLFNTKLPYDAEAMANLRTRPAREPSDYFFRQGHEADALAAELSDPGRRRRYIATFYTSRFWAHPGTFDRAAVNFATEPFADGAQLRAGFGFYESLMDEAARSEPAVETCPNPTPTMILFGPSDHVMYPDFDLMAQIVYPNHVGPFLLRDCGHFVPWEAPGPLVSGIAAWCGHRAGISPPA